MNGLNPVDTSTSSSCCLLPSEAPEYALVEGEFCGFYWNPIPESIVKVMWGKSWNEQAPVPLKDLAYLRVRHWNPKGELVTGELVYHKKLAREILEIFCDLYQIKYPIAKMVLIDHYDADDERSMEDNNSSAFCSRAITGKPGTFSNHSYGGTIDINPLWNPYIKGDVVLPKGGVSYLDRTQNLPGIIVEGDACYRAFMSRGYSWGGHWETLKDYQHFEKPASFLS